MNTLTNSAILKTSPFLAVLLASFTSAALAAPTIWDGPALSFTKAGFADPTLPENQDRMTDNVWITRANTQGIFNAASETAYAFNSSPADTLWAVGSTADLAPLSFVSWQELVGVGTPINGPDKMLGIPMVVHLVTDDIYLDLQFTAWGVGNGAGGNFTYTRSTPTVVPEPSTLALVACAFVAVVGWRRLAG